MSPEPLDSELANRFICQRCNECCKQPGFVYLQKGEEENIAAYLNLSPFDFVNHYTELLDRQKLVLKKYPNEHCIFLTEEGCRIHAVKPKQCQDFPFRWHTLASIQYCLGLKKILS